MNRFFSFLRYFISNFLFSLVYLIIIFIKFQFLFLLSCFFIYSKPIPCSRDFLLGLSKFSSPPYRIVKRDVFFLNLESCSSLSVLKIISSSTTSFFSSFKPSHSSLISSFHFKSKSFYFKPKSSNSSYYSLKFFKSINISFLNIRSLNNKSIHVLISFLTPTLTF